MQEKQPTLQSQRDIGAVCDYVTAQHASASADQIHGFRHCKKSVFESCHFPQNTDLPRSLKQQRKVQRMSQQFSRDLLLHVGGLGLQTPLVLFSTVQEMDAAPTREKVGLQL